LLIVKGPSLVLFKLLLEQLLHLFLWRFQSLLTGGGSSAGAADRRCCNMAAKLSDAHLASVVQTGRMEPKVRKNPAQ
jgi:hypothetical protein